MESIKTFISGLTYGSLVVQFIYAILLYVVLFFVNGKKNVSQKIISIFKMIVVCFLLVLAVAIIGKGGYDIYNMMTLKS